MRRMINIFDKQTEKFIKNILIVNFEEEIKNYYVDYIKDDPDLIFEYEINENDKSFFEKLLNINIDLNKYCYFLSCVA